MTPTVHVPSMVLTKYAKRIALFEAKGYCPSTIGKMLKSEGILVNRRGVTKFYQEYIYMCVTYLFALAGPRVAKHEKETTRACVHSPVPENGNGKIKTK